MKNLFDQYPILISILVLLFTARFVLVPVIDWQNEALWEIQQKEKRSLKSQHAISNTSENQQLLASLSEQKSNTESYLFDFLNESEFRLEQQQRMEQLVDKIGLKINNIGWSYSGELIDAPVIRHQMQLNIGGNTTDMPKFHLMLEEQKHWLQVDRFTINLRNQRNLRLGNAQMSLDLSFFQLMGSRTGIKGVSGRATPE